MAALRDLNILAYNIEYLLNDSNILCDPPAKEILEFAYKEVEWLEEIARRMNWMGVMGLYWIQCEVGDAVAGLLEKFDWGQSHSIEEDELKQEIQHLVDRVKKMEEEYAYALYNLLPPEDEEDGIDVSESIGLESKMVGLCDVYQELKEKLLDNIYYETRRLVGMPGIDKTTLAMKLFADLDIVKHFEVRIWVPVGRRCMLQEIQRRSLARLDPDCLSQMVVEREIAYLLKERLTGKRYLIVLDDMWVKNIEDKLLPNDPLQFRKEGSCILCLTRLEIGNDDTTMRLMNREESWDLLREKVFGEESCPTQLEKAGKKIAEHREGLPLTIVTIADHLSKVKEVEYWENVAEKKNHKLFKDVYDQISKVLLPSYNYLPRLLQICFLYMGVFPQNYEIPRSKLVIMWNVDGFLERNVSFDALYCMEELVLNNLVMIYKNTTLLVGWKDIKTCGLHSSLWHLSTTEARKTKFCHVLCSRDDGLNGDIIGQQRLSFHNNILCTIKDVGQFVEDNCASTIRSLFYYGPYNPFQVPICFGLRLVEELDILTVRFYEFPMAVLKSVRLRYLALTLDGKLPAAISQLSNLRFLIVGRHFVIIKPSKDRYLPAEIWNMQELKHLQATGSDLPHSGGASLENLSALLNVSVSSCTEEIFKAVPNLEKLGFRIELGPNDDCIPLRCFDHISNLKKLTSLKCAVVNPKILPPLALITSFPSNLRKLSLSGLGLHWKEMRKIAELPNLQALKLRNYTFRGPYWRVRKKKRFPSLHSLVIEDSDLVQWDLGSECFNRLSYLTLKHCYRYKRMVGKLPRYMRKIVFVDCNLLGIQQMKERSTQILLLNGNAIPHSLIRKTRLKQEYTIHAICYLYLFGCVY